MRDDLSRLEESVRFYERQVEAAREGVERARSHLSGAERDLEVATSFLEMERRRISRGESAPFGRMRLREACVSIVREKGRASTKEIVDALRKGGFELETKFPGRAVHMALMRAKEVRKIGPGSYETKERRLL